MTSSLPAGHHFFDIPVYPTAADAAAKTNPRVVRQAFDLPPAGTVIVPLAPPAS
jgi:hypothetical protein